MKHMRVEMKIRVREDEVYESPGTIVRPNMEYRKIGLREVKSLPRRGRLHAVKGADEWKLK